MNFKEWLELDEARFKGFKRMFQQSHPDMPRYVQNDLYNTRIGYALSRATGTDSGGYPTQKGTQTSPSPMQAMSGHLPSAILQKANLANQQWSKPTILTSMSGKVGVTPADFNEETQWRFADRCFGYREVKQIQNDMDRTMTQQKIALSGNSNEPVIVLKTPKGYKLLEGWHRTMALLLKGCPSDQLQMLQSGEATEENLNYSGWAPVKIVAFIGSENTATSDGTGDYNPAK